MASRPDRLRAESYISLRCLTGASGLRASPKLYGQGYDDAPDGAIPGQLERFGLMDDALRLSRMLGSALGLYSISRGLIIPTKRVQSLRSRSPICRRDCWLPREQPHQHCCRTGTGTARIFSERSLFSSRSSINLPLSSAALGLGFVLIISF